MAELRDPATITSPASMFLAHVDAVLGSKKSAQHPYDPRALAMVIKLYALFHDRLVIGDISTIYNAPLCDLLLGGAEPNLDAQQLLKDGTIVVSRRAGAGSFRDLDRMLREQGRYGAFDKEMAEEFAAFLDDTVTAAVAVDTSDMGAEFTEEARRNFGDRKRLEALGLSSVATEVMDEIARRAPGDSDLLLRSDFFDIGEQLQKRREVRREAFHLRELASVIYHGVHASSLGLTPAYPLDYTRHMGVLHGIPIGVVTPHRSWDPTDALYTPVPFAEAAVEAMGYEDIRAIRETRCFKTYIRQYRDAAASLDPHRGADLFQKALREYVTSLDAELSLVLAGTRARAKKRKQYASIANIGSTAGGALITLSPLVPAVAALESAYVAGSITFGLVWAFGGLALGTWLGGRAEKTRQAAREEALRHARPKPATSFGRGGPRRRAS